MTQFGLSMKLDNLLCRFFKANLHLISDEFRPTAVRLIETISFPILTSIRKRYDNHFILTNADSYDFYKIITELGQQKKHLSKKIRKYIKPGSTVFYCQGEGWSDYYIFSAIHNLIEILHLTGPYEYFDLTINNGEMYSKFCKTNNVKKKLICHTIKNCFNNQNFSTAGIKQYVTYDIKEQEIEDKKLYCCANLRSRPHRAGIIALLNYFDLINNNYVSSPYWFQEKESKQEDFENFKKFVYMQFKDLSFYDDILSKVEEMSDVWPLRIDNRTLLTHIDSAPINKDLYVARMNSLFEIIPETLFEGQHFFTEKTFYPIFLTKPFIMVNSYCSLVSLRRLGYKTFDPFIDETYDSIEDGNKRLIAISNEVQRLANLRNDNPKKFYNDYAEMLEIAKYNKEIFSKT